MGLGLIDDLEDFARVADGPGLEHREAALGGKARQGHRALAQRHMLDVAGTDLDLQAVAAQHADPRQVLQVG